MKLFKNRFAVFSSLKLSDSLQPLETRSAEAVAAIIKELDLSVFDHEELRAELSRLDNILKRRPHDFVIKSIRQKLISALPVFDRIKAKLLF